MIDQQVIMAGLAIDHPYPLVTQLPQIPDKPPGVPNRQGNGHVHIGPGKQEILLGTGCSGHAWQDIHFTGFQLFFRGTAAIHRNIFKADVQVLLQALEQVDHQPGRPAVLLEFEGRPV